MCTSVILARNKVIVVPLGDGAQSYGSVGLTPEAPSSASYEIINLLTVVLDRFTRLEWQRDTHSEKLTFLEARKYCWELEFGDKED